MPEKFAYGDPGMPDSKKADWRGAPRWVPGAVNPGTVVWEIDASPNNPWFGLPRLYEKLSVGWKDVTDVDRRPDVEAAMWDA